jgi:hypothetical protein
MIGGILKVVDALDFIVYFGLGAVLFLGSVIWVFFQIADVSPILALCGGLLVASIVGASVTRDIIRRRLGSVSKLLLAGWFVATMILVAFEISM